MNATYDKNGLYVFEEDDAVFDNNLFEDDEDVD